jgi:hypothetical protein
MKQSAQYNPGNKMRQIAYRLDELFVFYAPHLIEEYRENDRRGKAENQFIRANKQCIAEDFPKTAHSEQESKVFQPDPWALVDSQPKNKVFERYLHSI